jgi:homopolymeric O-antigen transport system permease protein
MSSLSDTANRRDAGACGQEPDWDVVISSRAGVLDLGLRDLWRYRDLIRLFVRRNYVVYYRQTVLGPLWYVVQPLTTTAVFTVIFSLVARLPTDQISPALFYLSGIVMWSNFSANLMTTSDVFVANMGIFSKVYFPRLAIPIATVLTNFISLGMQLAVFAAVFAVEAIAGRVAPPSPWVVLALPLFVVNALVALGFGLLMSGLTTRYRDMIQVLGFGIQLWMYATPVIYPLSQLPERWRLLAALNPISTTIELFRLSVFSTGSVSLAQVGISAIVAATALFAGLVVFSRGALRAADTV